MAGYNRVVLVGNLTRDPEHKTLPSGQSLCRLGLAINRQFKNRQTGTMVQEVCYVDIDVWGAQAESCRQYLQKGRSALVEGRLKFDTWEDQNGQTRSKHTVVADRVVFLSQGQQHDNNTAVNETSAQGPQLDSNNPVERDLMNQLEKAKDKVQAAKKEPAQVKKSNAPSAGEINFKDEPPFEDDLPF